MSIIEYSKAKNYSSIEESICQTKNSFRSFPDIFFNNGLTSFLFDKEEALESLDYFDEEEVFSDCEKSKTYNVPQSKYNSNVIIISYRSTDI